jgi:hypothetical protein
LYDKHIFVSISESEKYICSRCGETFEYIFPLKAHMKFRCEIGLSIRSIYDRSTRERDGRVIRIKYLRKG